MEGQSGAVSADAPIDPVRVPERVTIAPAAQGQRRVIAVRVTDVQMEFESMVTFMVKWAIASIPALLILLLIGGAVLSFLGMLANVSSR